MLRIAMTPFEILDITGRMLLEALRSGWVSAVFTSSSGVTTALMSGFCSSMRLK